MPVQYIYAGQPG